MYNKRLLQLKESVTQTAGELYGEDYEHAERVIDLKEGNLYYIVGTLYKSMKLKPSVLDQFKELAQITAPVEPLDDYTDDEDYLGWYLLSLCICISLSTVMMSTAR
jgi:DNA polymerase delta subunit 2